MKTGKTKTIKVNYLARVEGEGALHIKIKDDQVKDVKLKIFEPPRFFEAFLEGRDFMEAPDITARICGICPIAYQMSSVHAMESALGIKVEGQLRALRRLIYCGEWIESHVLHAFMLHAPDFLGYQDSIQMAADYPEQVKMGLEIKKIGNGLMTTVGGREIHPVNVRVGGFYRAPELSELAPCVERLEWARNASMEAVRWLSTLNFPEFEVDYEFVSLSHPDEYPFCEGRLKSNRGLDIAIDEFEDHFEEEHVKHSTSLHCHLKERGNYMVGPLARFNLEYEKLPEIAKEAARIAGLEPGCRNPFKSLLVRMVETVYACDEAIRIIANYEKPEKSFIEVTPKKSTGCGCSEAPRGICYHRYSMDDSGAITAAKIVPPTSQNQGTIEDDLRQLIPLRLDLPLDELTWQCEQAVRNYDPCISCSCHFLKLHIERG
ncbi:MAG: Ni/Fe hydrogenase subunit alpha [bacterium]|nr:Ni/Fe hydrogenase subunit alpha [bacterium]